jgi:hypothetical protein
MFFLSLFLFRLEGSFWHKLKVKSIKFSARGGSAFGGKVKSFKLMLVNPAF